MCVYVHIHDRVKKERKIQDIRKQEKTKKNTGHMELCWLAQQTFKCVQQNTRQTQQPSWRKQDHSFSATLPHTHQHTHGQTCMHTRMSTHTQVYSQSHRCIHTQSSHAVVERSYYKQETTQNSIIQSVSEAGVFQLHNRRKYGKSSF